jgi:tRNA threonylcarbamoyladenosine biosynthesis protein TsaB
MPPRILAIETMGIAGSVAACDGNQCLSEARLDTKQRSAQLLAPAIKNLLSSVGWRPSDVQLLAVAVGPGSFTGLRVGVTTAKAFAYAIGAEVIGVNTLDCIARQTPFGGRLSVGIDAQRQQVFARSYHRTDSGIVEPTDEAAIVEVEQWITTLDANVVISGQALEKFASRVPSHVKIADAECWSPRAATVGLRGFERWTAGERDDLWTLAPQYLRRSAAEEKLDQTEIG